MRQTPENHYMKLKSKNKRASPAPPKSTKKTKQTATNTSKAPKIGSYAFGQLLKEWNAKLKADGFKDLERYTETGEAYEYLSAQSLRSIANYYCPIKERHFMRLRNFVTHNPRWTRSTLHRLVGRLHSEGMPYRSMIKVCRAKGHTKGTSIFSIHRMVKKFEVRALHWNKTHPEGLDFVPDVG